MLYKRLFKPILFKFEPETVHDIFVNTGEALGRASLGRAATSGVYGYRGRDISKIVDGNLYKTPIMLSAGFDYNARLTQILPSLSFGGVEVGSVTARECAGNPAPRLKRLPLSKSLLVNKGLKNDGVDKIIQRLSSAKKIPSFVVGVSIARTNDQLSSSVEAGIQDYKQSFKKLNEAGIGDYYTLNISCPNAYGGETFTTPDLLASLLDEIGSVPCSKPVYVKMPINLDWEKFNALLKVMEPSFVKGVIVGNLNKDYSYLDPRERPTEYKGGISGRPCTDLSAELTRRVRGEYGKRFTIISCGGTMTVEDAVEKFRAGADLVQLITGMIYNGPGFIRAVCKEYEKERL